MKISVIMPVYNGKRQLSRSIKSLIGQRFSDWELICVDDASTDGTQEKLHYWCGRDSRIRMVTMSVNSGPLACRMRGVKEACSEYVAFIDAGDRFEPDGLQSMLAAAQATDADITIGATNLYFEGFHVHRPYFQPRTALGCRVERDCSDEERRRICLALFEGRLLCPFWDKLYRRDFLQGRNPPMFDVRIFEDLYFNALFFPFAKKITLTDVPYYEWSYSGMGSKYYIRGFNDLLKVYSDLYRRLDEMPDSDMREDAAKALSVGFMSQFVEGVAERIRTHGGKAKALSFSSEILGNPIMFVAGCFLEEFRGYRLASLSAAEMLVMGREQLRVHRKYYIFTRILNLIYRK